MKVRFFYQNNLFLFTEKTLLKSFIEGIFKKEGKKLESLNYIFCTDNYLLRLNRKYLKHDFYTDIITFDLSENKAVRAEIYISIDRIRENSRLLKVSFKSELHRVIIHGALHLCGYSDKNRSEKVKMKKKENLYLLKYLKKRST